jgi:CPA2 family monovalent cation:H+ antiporter-2
MTIFAAAASATALLELGGVLLVLGILGRLAARIRLPAIPFYLVAGLAVGEGGLLPLEASEDFIAIGSEIGVVLLLLLLGLEYSTDELFRGLRTNRRAGVLDAVANFAPGFGAGLLLGWSPLAAVLLGGVTYVSSSGIIARLLEDLGRVGNRETPVVLSMLVIEDLAMVVYLPVVAGVLIGEGAVETTASIVVALGAVSVVLVVSARYGQQISHVVSSESAELLLLTVLGVALVVAGIAQEVQVSAAVGAFLVGVSLSGPVAQQGRAVLEPLRDLFAGIFFVFFGLQVDPSDLPSAAAPAIGLAAVTAATKFGTGWWAARRAGIGPRGRVRAGTILLPRGEFAIVIAGLGVASAQTSELGSVTACYVLTLAILGPLLTQHADTIADAAFERSTPAFPARSPPHSPVDH